MKGLVLDFEFECEFFVGEQKCFHVADKIFTRLPVITWQISQISHLGTRDSYGTGFFCYICDTSFKFLCFNSEPKQEEVSDVPFFCRIALPLRLPMWFST